MKAFLRREGVFLIVLFLFALGLRLIYLHQLQQSPIFDAPIMDAKYHDEWTQVIRSDWSKALLEGSSLHEGAPYFRAPLYPYFLALVYSLSGHSYVAARVIQFIIGSLSVLLIYFLGKRLFNPMVGRIAAVLAAVYGTFIYFEGELLIPALILFLNLLFILAVLATQSRPSWWRWLGCGAILGLSAIARPTVLIFLVVLLPWMVARLRRQMRLGRLLAHTICLLLGAALVISPVHVHNYKMGKDFLPTMVSQGGVNFFIGNNRDSDGATAIVPGTRASWWGGYFDALQLAEDAEGRTLKASEVSAYWFKRGLEFMRDEPGAALHLMGKKLVLFWSGQEIANNKDIYFFSAQRPVLKFLIWPGTICCPFGILAPLALAGMVLAWRRREGRGVGLAGLFILVYMASVVLFFVNARFRLPVVPFLLPFAAYCLFSLFRERNLASVLFPVILIFAFGILVNMNLAGIPLPSRAESYTSVGNVYMAKGMYPQAATEFRRALAVDPHFVRGIAGLARMYDEVDSADRAIEQWERAISEDPEMMELYFRQGFSYYAAGRLDDAVASWEEAVRLQPEYAQPHFQLGIVYEDQGEMEKAIAAYRMALQQNPLYVLANYNLGHLYKKLGRIEEAQAEFERAVENNDRFGDAYNSLAWLYAQRGIRLDEGIELMGRALALDESKGAYWDTLAELYIKKGDLERAREIFRQMQQREPGEPFWTQRLREVGG